MGNILDKSAVLDRIKEYYSLKGNADLARFLGVAPNTITNWYGRSTFDIDVVYTKCEGVSLDWLLTGRGEMLISHQVSSSPKESPTDDSAMLLHEKDARIAALEKTISSQDRMIELLEEKIAILSAPPVVPVVNIAATG